MLDKRVQAFTVGPRSIFNSLKIFNLAHFRINNFVLNLRHKREDKSR